MRSATRSSGLIFRQLFDRESCTYTYLLACNESKKALLIDPVKELVDRDLSIVNELGLELEFCLNTHVHADHVTGSGLIKEQQANVQSVISLYSKAKADILVSEGESVNFGSHSLSVLYTPGHTDGCISYVLDDNEAVFTGDTLLYRGCGRTDFQSGSAATLYDSVHNKLFTLPDNCKVFPAHDYKGRTMSTIGEEKKFNLRLTKTKEEFIEIMANLGLSYPGKFDVAVPSNMFCGTPEMIN